MRTILRGALIAAGLGAAVGCGLAAIALPGGVRTASSAVSIDNFTFNPQTLTVTVGTTVTWTNKDDIPHAVAATNKFFRSKVLDTDNSFSFRFDTPGTYAYFCSLHPHMTGTVVVEAAASGAGR